jgi:hypothetical protein
VLDDILIDPAGLQYRHDEVRQGFRLDRLAARQVLDQSFLDVNPEPVTHAYFFDRVPDLEDREARVEGIPVEYPGCAVADNDPDPLLLEKEGRVPR